MSEIEADVVVIGGGAAGIAAAIEAARAGRFVVLVERGAFGGRGTHRTMIPLRAMARGLDRRTVREPLSSADFAHLERDALERAARWRDRLRLVLEDAGVTILSGDSRFCDAHRLETGSGETVEFDRAIVATGARAARLPGAAPDRQRLFDADDFLAIRTFPTELMVVGAGSAGAELVDFFSRAGANVTWVMDELGLLPSFDRELAETVGDVLMERGVKLVHGKNVAEISIGEPGALARLDGGRTYAAPVAIVAVGNQPCTDGLEALGLAMDARGAIEVDASCRTSVPHVTAAGDVTAWARDSATSEAMGRVAARTACGIDAHFEAAYVPRAAYTNPEIAQVGLSPESSAGHEVVLHTLRTEESLFGLLEGIGESAGARGMVRVVCRSEDGAVLGGSAIGSGAAEAVSAIALAMRMRATDRDLASTFAALPSRLDLPFRAAR